MEWSLHERLTLLINPFLLLPQALPCQRFLSRCDKVDISFLFLSFIIYQRSVHDVQFVEICHLIDVQALLNTVKSIHRPSLALSIDLKRFPPRYKSYPWLLLVVSSLLLYQFLNHHVFTCKITTPNMASWLLRLVTIVCCASNIGTAIGAQNHPSRVSTYSQRHEVLSKQSQAGSVTEILEKAVHALGGQTALESIKTVSSHALYAHLLGSILKNI